MTAQQEAFDALNRPGIRYEVVRHPAAGTIAEIAGMGILERGEIPGNLFLRDNSGKRHFLFIIRSDKKADLKAIARQLPGSRLSFASEARLERYLGLHQASVTAGVRRRLCAIRICGGLTCVGVHPNDNRATVFLRFADLCRLLEAYGHPYRFVKV